MAEPRILIIDDDPVLRLLFEKTLRRQGYQVSVAADGAEGLAQAQALCPELIICDWMMPTLDGLGVCRQVKADPNLALTFFILLTARDSMDDRVEGLDTGADEFLSKPVDLSELRARVRAGLRLHRLSRDLQAQKQLLEAELARAADYVRSLLPDPLAPTAGLGSGLSTHWRFVPSAQLGGDCFSYHWLDPERFAVYLLDVSGHGVGAALLSASVMNLLRSRSLLADFYAPDQVLAGLNQAFPMSSNNDLYFTLWYGVIDLKQWQITYSSGGHPPAILLSEAQEPTLLRTVGLPIGMLPEAQYTSAVQALPSVGRLYLFSDGIYELADDTDDIWGLPSFTQALAASDAGAAEPGQVLDQVIAQVYAYQASEHLADDLSLLQVCLDRR